MGNILKKVKLDQIELALEILKKDSPLLIQESTSAEIAELIQLNFGYECDWSDVYILHEPTIDNDILDKQIHYNMLGLL